MIKKFNRIETVIVNNHVFKVGIDKNNQIYSVCDTNKNKNQRVNETLYGRPFNAQLVSLIISRYATQED